MSEILQPQLLSPSNHLRVIHWLISLSERIQPQVCRSFIATYSLKPNRRARAQFINVNALETTQMEPSPYRSRRSLSRPIILIKSDVRVHMRSCSITAHF